MDECQWISIDGQAHIHPKGGMLPDGKTLRSYDQPADNDDVKVLVAPLGIVVGSVNDTVYFYNSGGTFCIMSYSDFMKAP